jgi:hypothetical protein
MKMINALLLISGLLSSTGVNAIGATGDISCGKWSKDRSSGIVKDQLSLASWLIGYLNGVARWSEVDILTNADRESLMVWMDNYCKTYPLESIDHGGFDLSIELIKKSNTDL